MANRKIKVIQVTGLNVFDGLHPETKVHQLRQTDNPANGLSTVADYMLDTLGLPSLVTKWLKINADGTVTHVTNAEMLADVAAAEEVHGHSIDQFFDPGGTPSLADYLDTKVPLDAFGKIVDSYFPEKVKGAVKFLGYFAAGGNIDTLFNAGLAAKGFAAISTSNWQNYQGMFIEATADMLTVAQVAGWKFWVGDDNSAISPGSVVLEAGDQLVFNQYAGGLFEIAVRSNQQSEAGPTNKGIVTISDPTGKTLATLDTTSDGDKVIDEAFLRAVMKDMLYIIELPWPADVRRVIETIPTGSTPGTIGEYVFCFQNSYTYYCSSGTLPNMVWSSISPITLPSSEVDGFSLNKLYHNTVADKYLVPQTAGKNSTLIESIPLVNDLAFIQQ